MKINHDIQLSDGKLKHFLNINNLPKSIIEDIINRAEEFHDNSKITKYTYRNDEIKLNNHKAFKLFLNEIEEYYCLPSIHPSFKSKLINVYFNCFYEGFDNNPNFLNLYE